MKRYLATFVSTLFLALLVACPIIFLIRAIDSLDLATIKELSSSTELAELSGSTAYLAFITALLGTFSGWICYRLVISSKAPLAWLAIYAMCFVSSPYIAAQGWIEWLGANGQIWQYLNRPAEPEFLHSRNGMLFLYLLQYTPLATIIFFFGTPVTSREEQNLERLLKLNLLKKEFLLRLPPALPATAASTGLLFWMAFWNFEIPSILRQNSYPSGLYAAFGSFYDYEQALGYMLHCSIYALPFLLIIIIGFRDPSTNTRSLPDSRSLRSNFAKSTLLAIVPLLSLLMPLTSIVEHVGGLNEMYKLAREYSNDIENTLTTGTASAVLAATVSSILACLANKYRFRKALLFTSLILLLIPPLCTGIGAIHWFSSQPGYQAGIERLISVNAITILPTVCIATIFIYRPTLQLQEDTLTLHNTTATLRFLKFLRSSYLPRMLATFLVAFLFSVKEVPATLLNYPPDGSTLVLSIETMLHFEQPQLISTLCAFQFLIILAVSAVTLTLIHFCKR